MRYRSKEINMLQDTLQILKQGYYEKNGKRIMLKLSAKEMKEIQVYLPDEVKRNTNREDFKRLCWEAAVVMAVRILTLLHLPENAWRTLFSQRRVRGCWY